jgi:transposase
MEKQQSEQMRREIESLRTRQIGGLRLLYPLLEALGVRELSNELAPCQVDVDLGRMVEILTLNRLLSPQPLYQVATWLGETVLPELMEVTPRQLYDNRIGRALDRLHPHLGELWARVVSRAIEVYELDLRTLHWDLTSLYLEGVYPESDLAAYGYSRDGRSDSKQVNLQVDTTHEGHVPILYQVLAGNTADITRPLPHLEALLAFLARPELCERRLRPLLVSDCKMITPEAVLACHFYDLYYLGPVADSLASEAVLRSVPAAELKHHRLAYRPQRVKTEDATFVPYAGVWRCLAFEHGGRTVTDRALVVWGPEGAPGKARLDQQKRRTYLKRLLNGLETIQKRLNIRRYKRRSYVEERLKKLRQGNPTQGLVDVHLEGEEDALTFHFRLDSQRLQAAQALDGRYLLVTNADDLDANQALTLFKGQDGVEKRFRTVKGPLLVRPLFVRSDQRIEGLIFISPLALLLRSLLEQRARQRGLALTATRLLRAFVPLCAVDLHWRDGSHLRQAAEPTPEQTWILATLGWPQPLAYARLAGC